MCLIEVYAPQYRGRDEEEAIWFRIQYTMRKSNRLWISKSWSGYKYCRCGEFTHNIALSEILAPCYNMRAYRERKLRKLPFPSLWAARLFTELLAISHSGIESPENAAVSVLVRAAFHSVRTHTHDDSCNISNGMTCACVAQGQTHARTHTVTYNEWPFFHSAKWEANEGNDNSGTYLYRW